MVNSTAGIMICLLITIASGTVGLYSTPLVKKAMSTDSASYCWNLGGIIDEKKGACVIPEQCPPGTARDFYYTHEIKCDPINTSNGSTPEQLTTGINK
ncbi:MAG: hypothetical protein P0116_11355 [Candidatus Nitrosocosmicus sp.]|nr:hypothetical protein [Candidatus Nitrosocosmicus sp.]